MQDVEDTLRGRRQGNLRREFGEGTPGRLHARALCGREVHERRGIAWGQSWRIFAPRVEMQVLANIGGVHILGDRLDSHSSQPGPALSRPSHQRRSVSAKFTTREAPDLSSPLGCFCDSLRSCSVQYCWCTPKWEICRSLAHAWFSSSILEAAHPALESVLGVGPQPLDHPGVVVAVRQIMVQC
jgi:hypothetical protein